MLYQFYPALVNGHFLTEYELFISHLVGSSDSNPEIVWIMTCSYNADFIIDSSMIICTIGVHCSLWFLRPHCTRQDLKEEVCNKSMP